MEIDTALLYDFERGINPRDLGASHIRGQIIGYGEISATLQIGDDESLVYKRLPIFSSGEQAEAYAGIFHEYCGLLTEAGINLTESETVIAAPEGRPVVLYIAQDRIEGELFCHKLIHTLPATESISMIGGIIEELALIWKFNTKAGPARELAIDGQISNWARVKEGGKDKFIYIDTSTPLYRTEGIEQQDPELMLTSVPWFLRWLIRLFFLKDVMERYYDFRLVCIDLAANLYKEQKAELVPDTVTAINSYIKEGSPPLTVKEVEKYYSQDKTIWAVFLAFRRFDRWLTTKVLRRRYEFVLPGKIQR